MSRSNSFSLEIGLWSLCVPEYDPKEAMPGRTLGLPMSITFETGERCRYVPSMIDRKRFIGPILWNLKNICERGFRGQKLFSLDCCRQTGNYL